MAVAVAVVVPPAFPHADRGQVRRLRDLGLAPGEVVLTFDDGPIPGPTPTLFFAPDHAVAAIKALGPKAFGEAVATSWKRFLADAGGAVAVDTRTGLVAAQEAFAAIHGGKADPAVGIVIRP